MRILGELHHANNVKQVAKGHKRKCAEGLDVCIRVAI